MHSSTAVSGSILFEMTCHSFGQDDWNEMQHDNLVMWCHWNWCWHYMMLSAFSAAALHSLGQANENCCWHCFHMMPLMLSQIMPLGSVSVSHDANSIINCTMTFGHRCHCHQHQKHVTSIALAMTPLYSLHQGNWNEVQNDLLVRWHH